MLKNKPQYLLLGLLVLICCFVFKDFLLLKKAYFFYDINCDGSYYSYPVYCNISSYLKHGVIPTWSFKTGMGQNIFPFMFRNPFDIILYLAGKDNILSLAIYVEVFKIILSGLLFYRYLKLVKVSDYPAVIGSLLFSFCSFITEGSAWFIFTFEAFNFALLLYGFELFYQHNKSLIFTIAVFLLCISMPFNIYLYGIFIIAYAAFRHFQTDKSGIKTLAVVYLKLAGIVLLACLLAFPVLLQNLFLLFNSPRGADSHLLSTALQHSSPFQLADKLQLGTCLMRFYSNDILGSGSNFKGWNQHVMEAPLLYCGLISLLLLPQVFSSLNRRNKITYIIFVAAWLLPMVFPYLRYAFWLFTGDYYRAYSFFVSFVFIYYSVRALDYIIEKKKVNWVTMCVTTAVLLILLFHPVLISDEIIDKAIRRNIAIMIISYAILLSAIPVFKKYASVKYAILILLIIELCYSVNITANRRDAFGLDWLKNEKVVFNDFHADAANYIESIDKSFYRIDRHWEPNTSRWSCLNFNQVQNYFSTSSYSPFNQLYYVNYLRAMGIVNKNSEKETRWAIGLSDIPVLEAENCVKYYIAQNGASPSYPAFWDSITTKGDVTIFKSKVALPLGYSYSKYITDKQFTALSTDQKRYVSTMAFVVSEQDTNKLRRLKRFDTNDDTSLLTDPSVGMAISNLSSLHKDTLAIDHFEENIITGYINFSSDKLLYFPVPYDDGWEIMVDVTPFKPIKVNGGMMGVFVEKGKHHIELHYHLRYLYKGLLVSILCIIALLIIYRKQVENVIFHLSSKIGDTVLSQRRNLILILIFAIVFCILYTYFHPYSSTVFFGDDLLVYKDFSGLHGLSEKIRLSVLAQKYRPVHDFVFALVAGILQKNVAGYYVVNILIQTINTLVFAAIAHIFLRSRMLSLFFSLTFGISRFCLFNINQAANGGPLEGLATTFFLLSILMLLRGILSRDSDDNITYKRFGLSILYANLCFYTHERYVVLLLFILLVIAFGSMTRTITLTIKHRIFLSIAVILSVILNVFIKKHFFSLPFFVGTGGTNISLKMSDVLAYFLDGTLSIMQINSGQQYLVGTTFESLNGFYKVLSILLLITTMLAVTLFLLRSLKKNRSKAHNKLQIVFLLSVLFALCLAPAVVTIRLEQRWLQASSAIYLLLFIASLSGLDYTNRVKTYLVIFFTILYCSIDFNYLRSGYENIYLSNSLHIGEMFKRAIDNNTIKSDCKKIYIWEKNKDVNTENCYTWTLGDSYFFDFYQNKKVTIKFVDSIYTQSQSGLQSSFANFHTPDEQIIYIKGWDIIDISGEYNKDSLKVFRTSIQ